MKIDSSTTRFEGLTVGQIVARDFRTAEVFKSFGIDFCCGGKKGLQEVCTQKNVKFEELISSLETLYQSGSGNGNLHFDEWELDFLADYIERIHHSYVAESILFMLELSVKVARVHGHASPEVVNIAEKFELVAEELTQHMAKEEQVLFPYIKRLVSAAKMEGNEQCPPMPFVRNPIRMMEMEHENAGNLLREIAGLSDNYTPPEYACNSWRVLYAKLNEFEDDLHQHVHLENNILFPKAIALEDQLVG